MKTLLIAFLFMSPLVASPAQQNPPPKGPPSLAERMKRTNEVIEKEVHPTAAQHAGIEKAFKNFFEAADKLRAKKEQPMEQKKSALDKLENERDETVKKLLNAAQFKNYMEATKKMRPPGPGLNERKGPPPPPHK